MELNERLYELRKSKGLSQEEVAERLSVTRQTVSKWETGQSTPDFDKVLPLCKLYNISTEELFTGKKPEREHADDEPVFSADEPVRDDHQPAAEDAEITRQKQQFRERSAWVVSIAVFIYIASIVVVSVGISVFYFNPVAVSGVMLLMIAFATAMLIRHYMSKPKWTPTPREKKEKTVKSRIKSIMALCVLIIYLFLSFLTMAWHITWILWCVYGLLCEIVNLIFMLKEADKDEA